jgi:hypothetical protein
MIEKLTGFQKGKDAEHMVADRLRAAGYLNVRVAPSFGPDITCTKDGIDLRIEVKRATHTGCGWMVHEVSPDRKSDDLLIIVFPDDSIEICSMHKHLALCPPNGRRSVSREVRARCPELYEIPKEVIMAHRERVKPKGRATTGQDGFKARRAYNEALQLLIARGDLPPRSS